ncbi:hypothetical protein A1O1_02505 [Capronia coronata CBS 617.96]|uniref:Uncharacterized protein n=1 Tax=Capronia coronata CBS 617.96 TaxID=1182541 RepID=W9YMF6_9EURO|nr:uncharacterized protein A1O1_02505 [Capronia coronata CBS 617.96]EXJ94112.1 hypothetical protein A1O1_02505 [Capronia coronata CBS 617.96]
MIYDACAQQRSTGLLLANKQIYNEFIPLLAEKFILSFHIDPAASSSVVEIVNQDGEPWGSGTRNMVDARSPHPDNVLETMPIDIFRRMRIVIDAPNPKDPGQLIRAWYQLTRLLAALLPRWRDMNKLPTTTEDIVLPEGRETTQLPHVDVIFRQTGQRKWAWGTETRLNHSLPSFHHWDDATNSVQLVLDGPHSDLEVLLIPLRRIRDATSLNVHMPPNTYSDPELRQLVSVVQQSAKSEIPFGLNQCLDEVSEFRDDDECLGMEDALHFWFDFLLDDLSGKAAAMVRRERFQYWCAEYEHQLGYHLDGFCGPKQDVIGSPAAFMDIDLVDHIANQFFSRYAAGYHMYQTGHRNFRCSHQYWEKECERDDTRLREVLWEKCYPNGIAPKSLNPDWDEYPTPPWFCPTYPQRVRSHTTLTADRLICDFSGTLCHECDLGGQDFWNIKPMWRNGLYVYLDSGDVILEEP